MTAREHDIDGVARAMTTGAPGAEFAKRVMAPICGRPRPGFTGRVMARVDSMPERARPSLGFRALRPALAAAGALAMLAALWRAGDVVLPAMPTAPLVHARVGELSFVTPARARIAPRGSPRVAQPESAAITTYAGLPGSTKVREFEQPPYRIAELELPAGLVIRAIAETPPTVAPLERPSALTVPVLRFEKEKP